MVEGLGWLWSEGGGGRECGSGGVRVVEEGGW